MAARIAALETALRAAIGKAAERESLSARVSELQAANETAAEREALGKRAAMDNQLQAANETAKAAEESVATLKRSRLLRLGRWLRRIRGLPLPY